MYVKIEYICTSFEDLLADIALGGVVLLMTFSAVDLLILECERLIHERRLADAAVEAPVVPMPLLVRQILQQHRMKHFHVYIFKYDCM